MKKFLIIAIVTVASACSKENKKINAVITIQLSPTTEHVITTDELKDFSISSNTLTVFLKNNETRYYHGYPFYVYVKK